MVVIVEGVPWLVAVPPDGGLEVMFATVMFCAIVSTC